MECYVDKMIVKSLLGDDADDLRECVEVLRRNNMKINPKKCTFRVASGKFWDIWYVPEGSRKIRGKSSSH